MFNKLHVNAKSITEKKMVYISDDLVFKIADALGDIGITTGSNIVILSDNPSDRLLLGKIYKNMHYASIDGSIVELFERETGIDTAPFIYTDEKVAELKFEFKERLRIEEEKAEAERLENIRIFKTALVESGIESMRLSCDRYSFDKTYNVNTDTDALFVDLCDGAASTIDFKFSSGLSFCIESDELLALRIIFKNLDLDVRV